MPRIRVLLLFAVVASSGIVAQPVASAQENAVPAYQRRRAPVGDVDDRRPDRDKQPPRYYQRRQPVRRFPQRQGPAIAAGSFQRPYPYHLDYYKQKYNGGYEPYFGNLYGPPNIVGTQPFAFSEYPPQPQGVPNAGPPNYAPTQPPLAAPMIICPHCQQPIQLQWQEPTQQP
ncbi:MAG: hypothetical protein AAGF31_03870 [Planctomycetota bacterium]